MSSPAYLARKMYGDTVPGDCTHDDVKKEFSEFFKHYIRNLPKLQEKELAVQEKDVKQFTVSLFQVR